MRRPRRPLERRSARTRARSSRRPPRRPRDAMREGAPLIYQAQFFDGRWQGRADFLRRIAGPVGPRRPRLRGARHQARAAGQAARRPPAQPLQPAARARSRASSPRYAHVVLGDGARSSGRARAATPRCTVTSSRGSRRVASARRRPTYPEPVAHCAICALADECRERRVADDHLSLVAGARRDQRERLVELRDRRRCARWPHAPETLDPGRSGPSASTLLHHQAALQVESRDTRRADPPPPRAQRARRATRCCPSPSRGRRVLRPRGRPVRRRRRASSTSGAGGPRTRATSASGRTTPTPRRRRSSAFVDRVGELRARASRTCTSSTTRRTSSPSCARCRSQYATREDEVDDLLRGERARRPLRRRAPGPAGRRGELLAQEARAPPRLRAPREARARGRRLDRRLRDLAGDRRRRAARGDPRLQRGGLPLDAVAARLAARRRCAPRPRREFGVDFDDLREPEPEEEHGPPDVDAGRRSR